MPSKKRPTFVQQMKEIAPLMAYGGSFFVTACLLVNKLATKDYVDDRDKQILAEAVNHSDSNKSEMRLEIKGIGTDVKSIATKTDILLDMKQRELGRK